MRFTLNMATNSDKAFEINDGEYGNTEVIVGQPEYTTNNVLRSNYLLQ